MTPPLVSIIIPAYNAAPWLAETIENALGQTWQRTEIIVANDGSTDETLIIAQRYEPCGVRVISQPNRGLSGARNLGLRSSTGDYVQFLDADDLMSPDKIEHQVVLLNGSPPGRLATGRWARFRRDPAQAQFNPSALWRDLGPLDYLRQVARNGKSVPVHAWLLPRKIVDDIGPFAEDVRVMEDQEYFARAVLASTGLCYCPQGCSYYRSFHAKTLALDRRQIASESMLRAVQLIESHLLKTRADSEMRQIAADYYQWLAFKLYPEHPNLIRVAESRVQALGGSNVKPLLGRRGQALSRLVGWKFVQRLRAWLWSRGIYLGKDAFISD